jgi:hypothetical protein
MQIKANGMQWNINIVQNLGKGLQVHHSSIPLLLPLKPVWAYATTQVADICGLYNNVIGKQPSAPL